MKFLILILLSLTSAVSFSQSVDKWVPNQASTSTKNLRVRQNLVAPANADTLDKTPGAIKTIGDGFYHVVEAGYWKRVTPDDLAMDTVIYNFINNYYSEVIQTIYDSIITNNYYFDSVVNNVIDSVITNNNYFDSIIVNNNYFDSVITHRVDSIITSNNYFDSVIYRSILDSAFINQFFSDTTVINQLIETVTNNLFADTTFINNIREEIYNIAGDTTFLNQVTNNLFSDTTFVNNIREEIYNVAGDTTFLNQVTNNLFSDTTFVNQLTQEIYNIAGDTTFLNQVTNNLFSDTTFLSQLTQQIYNVAGDTTFLSQVTNNLLSDTTFVNTMSRDTAFTNTIREIANFRLTTAFTSGPATWDTVNRVLNIPIYSLDPRTDSIIIHRFDSVIVTNNFFDSIILRRFDSIIVNNNYFDSVIIERFDSVITNNNYFDSIIIRTVDSVITNNNFFDSIIVRHFDSIIVNNNYFDSVILRRVDSIVTNNNFYDSIIVRQVDSIFTNTNYFDSIIIRRVDSVIVNNNFFDSVIYRSVLDSAFINQFFSDTTVINQMMETVINNLFSDTSFINSLNQQIYNIAGDTAFINRITRDTTFTNTITKLSNFRLTTDSASGPSTWDSVNRVLNIPVYGSESAGATDTSFLRRDININTAAIATKENFIPAGDSTQYWAGDKTWKNFLPPPPIAMTRFGQLHEDTMAFGHRRFDLLGYNLEIVSANAPGSPFAKYGQFVNAFDIGVYKGAKSYGGFTAADEYADIAARDDTSETFFRVRPNLATYTTNHGNVNFVARPGQNLYSPLTINTSALEYAADSYGRIILPDSLFRGSQNLQQVTSAGSTTTLPVTAASYFASGTSGTLASIEGFTAFGSTGGMLTIKDITTANYATIMANPNSPFTAPHTYTLPDRNGTFAMVEDIAAAIPAQFAPIAGTNMTITGTYPNLTFNAAGGGSAVGTITYQGNEYDINNGNNVILPAFDLSGFSTDNLLEGTTNLYFSNQRAREAFTVYTNRVGGVPTYDMITGDLDLPQVPLQFTPLAGTNMTITGTYPNMTFNAAHDTVLQDLQSVSDEGSTTTNNLLVGGISVGNGGDFYSPYRAATLLSIFNGSGWGGSLSLKDASSNFNSSIGTVTLTQDVGINFPNKSGTVALLDDIVGGGGGGNSNVGTITYQGTAYDINNGNNVTLPAASTIGTITYQGVTYNLNNGNNITLPAADLSGAKITLTTTGTTGPATYDTLNRILNIPDYTSIGGDIGATPPLDSVLAAGNISGRDFTLDDLSGNNTYYSPYGFSARSDNTASDAAANASRYGLFTDAGHFAALQTDRLRFQAPGTDFATDITYQPNTSPTEDNVLYFPNKSGVLATLDDITGGGGATPGLQAVTDVSSTTTNSMTVVNDAGLIGIGRPAGAGSSTLSLSATAGGQLVLFNNQNWSTTLTAPNASAARSVVFPDKSGTVAMLDDITGGAATDTTSLSNRINLKLNITDTANMRLRPVAGTNMTITGTYPNLTFNAAGGGAAVGTITWLGVAYDINAGANVTLPGARFAVAGEDATSSVNRSMSMPANNLTINAANLNFQSGDMTNAGAASKLFTGSGISYVHAQTSSTNYTSVNVEPTKVTVVQQTNGVQTQEYPIVTAIEGTTAGNNGNVVLIQGEYADNAAAIAGGLTVGKFYRTGDVVKVVH